jgi:hypothetical protein
VIDEYAVCFVNNSIGVLWKMSFVKLIFVGVGSLIAQKVVDIEFLK